MVDGLQRWFEGRGFVRRNRQFSRRVDSLTQFVSFTPYRGPEEAFTVELGIHSDFLERVFNDPPGKATIERSQWQQNLSNLLPVANALLWWTVGADTVIKAIHQQEALMEETVLPLMDRLSSPAALRELWDQLKPRGYVNPRVRAVYVAALDAGAGDLADATNRLARLKREVKGMRDEAEVAAMILRVEQYLRNLN